MPTPSTFYTITMSRLFALSQPVRAGEFSNSHALIPDWIVCVAGRFSSIHTSFEAGGDLLRGPHQSEWRPPLSNACLRQ